MDFIGRRRFLSFLSRSAAAVACWPIVSKASTSTSTCSLDLCAPFIIEDPDRGLHSEIVLTADTFVGSKGHADRVDSTEYELHLYDASGVPIKTGGPTAKLEVAAMQTTVVAVRDLLPAQKSFWGGLTVRVRPLTRQPMHASDLFSSAFVRWQTDRSFTTVHANPDPREWQRADSFFYSMPFPPLSNYDCVYGIFNPYNESSAGAVTLYDQFGNALKQLSYDLKPHSSGIVDLTTGDFAHDLNETFNAGRKNETMLAGASGGTIAVTNRPGTVKNFGYLLIKQTATPRFSIEHPIHQPPFNPAPARVPFDTAGRFKAQNILYTPLVFHSKKLGGLTLQTRFHLSSGAPVEEALWLSPFITDEKGDVVWQAGNGSVFPASVPKKQIERGAMKLMGQQSCVFDCTQLDLPKNFSGGLSLAITPLTNHTLMKVEVIATEWNATAFTHFRPGLAAARAYQKPAAREGLATDYIVSGAYLKIDKSKMLRDEVVAVINIDDKAISGSPTLEIFNSSGLVTRVSLGAVPAFSCRHYLLSALLSEKIAATDLSLRLVDEQATLLMSVLHLDYARRDIAADHGSDRFSTFAEFTCGRSA
jgi:hypothetical protein